MNRRKRDLDIESALRARFFAADFCAPSRPAIVANAEYNRIAELATAVATGRLTIAEARAQLRGAA